MSSNALRGEDNVNRKNNYNNFMRIIIILSIQ